VIVLFLILSCIDSNFTAYGQTQNLAVEKAFVFGDPIKLYDWNITPRVKICDASEINKTRVDKALKWWSRLGYSFEEPTIEPGAPACLNKNMLWSGIVITLPSAGYDYKYYAMTETYRDEDKDEIVMARIYIREDAVSKDRVLEHEIGHALGWQHYPQKYHMMHPEWDEGGYSWKGLKAR
jgi:predicted Zn-dependent protease